MGKTRLLPIVFATAVAAAGLKTWWSDKSAATESVKAENPVEVADHDAQSSDPALAALLDTAGALPQPVYPSVKSQKPLLVLDLGHRGRYAEGKCAPDAGSVQGNRRGGVSEADIVDALGRVLLRELENDRRFDVVTTRAPGQELAGGCMAWRASLVSRLDVVREPVAQGRRVMYVSVHVDESGWVGINDLSVFMAAENPASAKFAQDFARHVRVTDPSLRTRVKPDTKNTLVLHNEAQTAVPVLLEFSDIRFADQIIRPQYIAQKGAAMAAALRTVMHENGPVEPAPAFTRTPSPF